MSKAKKIVTNFKVIILLVALLFAVIAIHPAVNEGVAIRTVAKDSAASLAGIKSPEPKIRPVARERVLAINNVPIKTVSEYHDFVSELEINQTLQIKTNQRLYRLTTEPLTKTIVLNETEFKEVNETIEANRTINGTIVAVNETITKLIEVNKTKTIVLGTEDIGLSVYDAPGTNIKKGLDLDGGTRVLLQPEEEITEDEILVLIDNMKQRLNVYGLTDIVVREAGDLSGNAYILVEIAGATKQEVGDLLAKQGKFEAKIGEETVFRGGQDITYVCRSADCAGIDPATGCSQFSDGWFCRFRFAISLSPEAAERQAELTKNLDVVPSSEGEDYLSEKLVLILDDQKVDELNIGADLKGRAVTDIQISGGGSGATQQEAVFDSLNSMKRLQTILITGSLPIKLNIVKTDAISPVLGEEFVRNILFVGLIVTLSVAAVIFVRFRKIKITVPIIITMIAEIVLVLGIASLIGWNMDLAAIAGIILAVGTGVNDQIVITDEILRRETQVYGWRERIKQAFFIVMAAYSTMAVAMIPLLFAGAGLLKGFAITTLLGVSVGVFITRPAYASAIEILLKD